MSLEQDIQQKKFRNEHQKVVVNMLYTGGWLKEKISAVFESEEITPQQFNILRILRGSHPKPLSTQAIRNRMLEKMSDTSRIVDRLVTKNLVKKVTCEKDRRLVDVVITEKGQALLERLDRRDNDMDDIVRGLNEKEAAQLNQLLDKVRQGRE